MGRRRIIVLGIVTALALVAAGIATHLRAPAPEEEKPLLFPDLRTHATDIARITLTGHDRSVTLSRNGDNWVIDEADGYPALPDRVRDTVLGITGLRKLADKTSNAKMFKRLGVEDVTESGSNSVQLDLFDATGKSLAALVVGRQRRPATRLEAPAVYVRLPGAPSAMLAEGSLDVSTDIGKWLNRDLFHIASDRVRSVEITHADGSSVRLARGMPGADLELANVPKGREAQSSVVLSRMGTVLESFFLEGARAATKVEFPEDAPVMTVHTFDGIVATLTSARIDEKPMTRIQFSYQAPSGDADGGKAAEPPADAPQAATGTEAKEDPGAEAERYAGAVRDWVFQVPQFKFDLLTRHMEDLVRNPIPKGESPIRLPE